MNLPDKSKLGTRTWSEQYIKKEYSEFWELLQQKFPGFDYHQQLYMFLHNMAEPHRCPVCGKYTKLQDVHYGYRKYCSSKCNNSDEQKKERTKKSIKEKYGVDNISQLESAKQKKRDTLLKKYGTTNVSALPEIQAKKRQTKLERYGNEKYTNIELIKKTKLERYGDAFFTNQAKREETNLKRYGTASPYGNKEVQQKSKSTKLERYGDEHYYDKGKRNATLIERYGTVNTSSVPEIQQKRKDTLIQRYGTISTLSIPEIQQKRKETLLNKYGDDTFNNRQKSKKTCLEKYGTEHPNQTKEIKEKGILTLQNRKIQEVDELIGYTEDGRWICKCPHLDCQKCVEKSFTTSRNIFYDRKSLGIETCTKLLKEHFDTNSGTTIELFVQRLLDEHNIEYIKNIKKVISPYELDIYIPSKNIAIECNGVRWHSTWYNDDRNRHVRKWRLCKELGIQLISIWEDWIINKPQIVESLILSKLGIYKQRVGARKCSIIEVTNAESDEFLIQNHIQGTCKSSIRYGLIYQDQLISLMCFAKTKEGYELVRFCNKLNCQVVGGASRLFNHFLNSFPNERVISFSSNDISDGNLYIQLGFKSNYHLNHCYWYITRDLTRYHRRAFSKDTIVKKGIRPNKEGWTEDEVTRELKLFKIWDSGQLKWIYKKEVI